MASASYLVSPGKGRASITDASQTGLDLTGNFTVEFWIRADTAGGGDQGDIITKLRGSSGDEPYAVYKNGTSVVLRMYNGTNVTQISWASILTNDGSTWEHIAIAVTIANSDATKAVLYKNSVSQGNGTVDTAGGIVAMVNTNGDFVLGDAGVRADGLNAELFDVRIWAAVRTSGDISANYNLVLSDPDGIANLVGDWYLGGRHHQDRAQLTSGRNDLTPLDVRNVVFVASQPTVTGPFAAVSGKLLVGGPLSDEVPPVALALNGVQGRVPSGGPWSDEVPPVAVAFNAVEGSEEALGEPSGSGGVSQLTFVMRGYNASLAKFDYWEAPNIDSGALLAPDPPNIVLATVVIFERKDQP